jgi:hypothetical protein
MIGHQAVTQEPKPIQCAVLAKQTDIDQFVGIGFQDESASVPPLRDVVCNINDNDSGQTSHGKEKISKQ